MSISPKLQQIAKMAKDHPERAFTNLAHHLDLCLLKEAYRLTRKDGAVGTDGITGADYAENLEDNLHDLLRRAKSGSYRAPAVRRVHIPKGDGRTRPLGIPTFEDKVLQRAVAMILGAIYEEDFSDSSFGFRPRRSQHQALDAIWHGVMKTGGGWVLEADIRDCFGTLNHGWLRKILGRRIRDGVLLRLIGKWLKAGIIEDGNLTRPDAGTPQGGVISPLLCNIYLHDVLDVWFERTVLPRIRGRAFMVRFADDFVMVFTRESDAQQIYEVLPQRFERLGLELHPEKTRLLPFRRPPGPRSESFDFLGFTHYWSRSRTGTWIVKRKTMSSRLNRALKRVSAWCALHRHDPIRSQHQYLSSLIRGHCQYYGVTGNSAALWQFRQGVRGLWMKWLKRRSNSARRPGNAWWDGLCRNYPLPPAHAVHSILGRS